MDYKKMTARAIVGLMVSDGSITEEIIVNLKRVEQDYRIDPLASSYQP